jgi:hypothetical protein
MTRGPSLAALAVASFALLGASPLEPLAPRRLRKLEYTESRANNVLSIAPTLEYRALHAAGGPVPGLPVGESAFDWDFPGLSFKLTNNTDKVVMLTEATFETKGMTPLSEPLLVWDDHSFTQLVIRNEGWDPVKKARLSVDVTASNECDRMPAPSRYARTVDLADFDGHTFVPILDYVPSRYRADPSVCVFGTMSYKAGGVERQVSYHTRVRQEVRATAGHPPSNFYDVKFNASKRSEVVRRPLEQEIAPGGSDHFVVRVAVDRSARFDLHVSLRAIGARQIQEHDYRMELFVPRSEAKRTRISSRP